jgi:hypothetical protein
VLAAAELVEPHKNGRSIRYSPRLDAVSGLAAFLVENCCARGGCNPSDAVPCETSCRPGKQAGNRKQRRTRRPR